MAKTSKSANKSATETVNPIKENKILTVKLSDLIVDEAFNARDHRYFDTPEIGADQWQKIEDLMADIKEHGQLTPMLTVMSGDKFKLVAGFRRHEALKRLKAPTAVIEVVDAKRPEDADILNLTENIGRNNLRPYEIAKKVTQIKANHGLSGDAIAKRIGNLSKSYVNNLIRCYENIAVDEIRDAWANPGDNKHKFCTTDFLNSVSKMKLVGTEKPDKDAQKLAWDEACGKVAPAAEGEGGGEDGEGEESKPSKKKMRRHAEVVGMLTALSKGSVKGDKKRQEVAMDVLRWVLLKGPKSGIPGLTLIETDSGE